MKLLVILALLFGLPHIEAQDRLNHFVLISYCIDNGVYRFRLASFADFAALTNHVSGHRSEFPGAEYLRDASALKRTMDRVPEGSVIEWRGWKPADTCYPPKPVIDDIRAFARSRHIDVRLLGYDPTE